MKLTLYKLSLIYVIILQLSCASLINSKFTSIDVYTSSPVRLLVNSDTLKKSSVFKAIVLQRSKEPMIIKSIVDTATAEFSVKPINSLAYKANIGYAVFGWLALGLYFIDYKKAKRFTYPSQIYLDIDKKSYSSAVPKKLIVNENPKNVIKFTPFRTIDFVNPAIEIVYERRTSNAFSTQFTLLGLLSQNFYDEDKLDGFGYRVGIEERYYHKNMAPSGFYYALEASFMKKDYFSNIVFQKNSEIKDAYGKYDTYEENVLVYKRLFDVNFKLGYQIIIKNFVLDGFVGLGIRHRNVTHQNRSNYEDLMQRPRHPNVHYDKNLEGKRFGISLPLNIRIGYSF